jgi:hypothetical protein
LITLGVGVVMARGIWISHGRGDLTAALADYSQYMNNERAHYGWDKTANVFYLLMHLHRAVPMMFAAGIGFVIWFYGGGRHCVQARAIPGRRLAAIGLSTLPYCLVTWYNPDLSFNNRLVLPLAWVLVPAAAAMIQAVVSNPWMKRNMGSLSAPRLVKKIFLAAFGSLAVCVALNTAALDIYLHLKYCDYQAEVFNSVLAIPKEDSGRPVAVVGGPGAPMVIFLHDLDVRPDMVNMMPGFDATPENMTFRMRKQLDQGRRVFVNLSGKFQTRPDGKCFEWTATYAAAQGFRRGPGPGMFVEILPSAGTSTPATASILMPASAPWR